MKPASRFLPLRYHALALGRTLQALWWELEDWLRSRWPLVRDESLTHATPQELHDRFWVEAYLRSIESSLPPLSHRQEPTKP